MSTQPTSDPDAPETASQALRVRVRMYRPGLGDCFLISFFQAGAEHHVLIDCGVYQATKDAEATMLKIARHIHKTTNQRLDLVAATHEHWDHLSGFQQAQEVFNQIAMEQVWLAWTEDPANPLANKLREDRSLALRTLQAAARLIPSGMAMQGQAVQGLLDFFGASPAELSAASSISPARQALDYLASRKDAKVSYCQPGEPPRTLEGLPGVRFFVLGPPTSEALLKKTEPGKKSQEGYALSDQVALVSSFFNAIQHLQGSLPDSPGEVRDFPFDPQFQVSIDHARQDPFFIEHYGFGDGLGNSPQQGAVWRRIDRDWLEVTSELALRLDQATNNTSLVLAIELVESGQVLLFPGDAQAGNWLSWKDLSWDLTAKDGATQTIHGGDLVARTTLYKVGHHGSHNATLRESGLERMQSSDLVALLPVQQAMAEQQNWSMPFPRLYQRLQEKTRGRLARLDYGLPAAPPQAENGLPLLTQAEWEAFRHKTSEQPLYIDYFLE
jgi:beta-lactamase superfamily II metal-dependent hydrolase